MERARSRRLGDGLGGLHCGSTRLGLPFRWGVLQPLLLCLAAIALERHLEKKSSPERAAADP